MFFILGCELQGKSSGSRTRRTGKTEPQRFRREKVVVREPLFPAKQNPQGSELIKSVELNPPQGRN